MKNNTDVDVEHLLLRLARVSSDITKSVNFGGGSITKAQDKEQDVVLNKLSKVLDIDKDYIKSELNK